MSGISPDINVFFILEWRGGNENTIYMTVLGGILVILRNFEFIF